MSSEATIRALVVGINQYLTPGNNLRGCDADLHNVIRYLKELSTKLSLPLKLVPLLDEQATRQAIIDEFQTLFANPQPQDICLFYFSGHGSRQPVPLAFMDEFHTDLKLETLVCYDSRAFIPNNDLADKELAWLVWQATRQRMDHPFLLLLDSCHSGGLHREDPLTGDRLRSLKDGKRGKKLEQFLGYEDYIIGAKPHLRRVPEGRYLMLSACRDKQYAREKDLDSKVQGVFTHALIETLRATQHPLSYKALINTVRSKVAMRTESQTPQIRAKITEDRERHFPLLMQETDSTASVSSHASYDLDRQAWKINRGTQQFPQIQPGDWVDLFDANHPQHERHPDQALYRAQILEVQEEWCWLSSLPEGDLHRQLQFQFVEKTAPLTSVAFHSEDDQHEALQYLETAWQNLQPTELAKTQDPNQATYVVRVIADSYEIKSSQDQAPRPCYPQLAPCTLATATQVIQDLQAVVRWQRLWELRGPAEGLAPEAFTVALVEESPHSSRRAFRDLNQPIKLQGRTNEKGELEWPHFSLMIGAESDLFFTVLRLSQDFSITDDYLTDGLLVQRGRSIYLEKPNEGHRYLRLKGPATHFQMGGDQWTERFKILVSQEQVDGHHFLQAGIPHRTGQDPSLGMGNNRQASWPPANWQHPWAVIDIELILLP